MMSKHAFRWVSYGVVTAIVLGMNGFILLRLATPDVFGESALYFLPVGQGDAELITTEGASFLIDAGSDDKVVQALDALFPLDRHILDLIFISHGQKDHVGGLFTLVDRYSVGAIIYGGTRTELWDLFEMKAKEKNIPIVYVSEGDAVHYGDNNFSILWPSAQEYDSTQNAKANENNDISMVLKFSNGDLSALYTADISQQVEEKIKNISNIASTVLKVAHHGSKYSSSEAFLAAVSPLVGIIEVGKNSYGHPTQDVLDRLSARGIKILRTDQQGLIKITKNGKAVSIGVMPASFLPSF